MSFTKIGQQNMANIEICLLDIKASTTKPPNINKSDNFIFVSVKTRIAANKHKAPKNSLLSINVTGKCSLIESVVLP